MIYPLLKDSALTAVKRDARYVKGSLRTADVFPVVASVPPKKNFSEEEKQRPEIRLRLAG